MSRADEIRTRDLMRYALGVHEYHCPRHLGGGTRFSTPYRNHFYASGADVVAWDGLVARGFAAKRSGSEITGGDPVYFVTEAGRTYALGGIVFKRRWGYVEVLT